MSFDKPLWKYMNGIRDRRKKESVERVCAISTRFKHDKEHAELIKAEYKNLCVEDGIFESIEDFEGAIKAHAIRSQL